MKNIRRKADVQKPTRTLPVLAEFIGKAVALLAGRSLVERARAATVRAQQYVAVEDRGRPGPQWRYVGHDHGKKYNGKMLRALRSLRGVGSVRRIRS